MAMVISHENINPTKGQNQGVWSEKSFGGFQKILGGEA